MICDINQARHFVNRDEVAALVPLSYTEMKQYIDQNEPVENSHYVYRLILRSGISFLVVSSDLDEIFSLAGMEVKNG